MNLLLAEDGGGWRHFLDDKPVSCGTQLRLRVNKRPETWVWARYECNLASQDTSRHPVFHTIFGLVIPDELTVLRWPNEDER